MTVSMMAESEFYSAVVEDARTKTDLVANGGSKRKASDDDDCYPHGPQHHHHRRDDSPKRARYDDSNGSPPAEVVTSNTDQERRKQAAQEEKKRGKRLFGGLMSTLSQTSTATQQQKRRLEIERRQQDRMQKQKAEDDEKRVAKLARLQRVRTAEQIAFDEDVMKNGHAKRLAMARFLQTKSHPQIYFLPWRPTPEQEDVINERVRAEQEAVAREVEQFEARKRQHIEQYGPSRARGSMTPDRPVVTAMSDAQSSHGHVAKEPQQEEAEEDNKDDGNEKVDQQAPPAVEEMCHDQHDESGDVLVEAEEDMVIY